MARFPYPSGQSATARAILCECVSSSGVIMICVSKSESEGRKQCHSLRALDTEIHGGNVENADIVYEYACQFFLADICP